MSNINQLVEQQIIYESIPWRNAETKLDVGETSLAGTGTNQYCLILNNLKFIMKLAPSFMFIIPKIELLQKPGGATNGYIIVARKAQQLEFTKKESGSCYAKTYFFGRSKEKRTFDIIQRIFERGFSLSRFNEISTFDENAVIEITCKKLDFHHATFFTGKQFPDGPALVPARIKNVTKK